MKFITAIAVLFAVVAAVSPTQGYRCLPLGEDCSKKLVCCPGTTCSKSKECVKVR